MRSSAVSKTAVTIRTCIVAASLLATRVLAVDVITPGQTVPEGQVGVLPADLVCAPPNAVYLANGATLDLNGHVLDGCSVVATGFTTDTRRIGVRGPGEIRNAGVRLGAGSVRVSDVDIYDAPDDAIRGFNGSTVRVANVTITGSGGFGINATRVAARNVTSNGNGVNELGIGIFGGGGVIGRDLTVTDNNGEGVFAFDGRTTLRDSEVTGNAYSGVFGFRVSMIRSTVTGNNTSGSPNTFDLVSSYPPRVTDSTCGTSQNSNGQGTWGVCSGD